MSIPDRFAKVLLFLQATFLYSDVMKHLNKLAIDVQAFGLANETHQPSRMARAHRHNEVEMNFVVSGAMSYLFGGSRVEVQAGETALFWAAIPHQLVDVAEGTIYHWLTIPFPTFLRWQLPDSLTQQVICGQFVIAPAAPELRTTQDLFQQWNTDLRENLPEQQRIVLLEVEAFLRRQALALANVDKTASKPGRTTAAPHELSNIERMACYVAEHYTEPLHIDSIAQVVHLHPNYAQTLFRKHFGMGMIDYITHYRVVHAQRLLLISDLNASEIALEAGFGSVSRFYTAFKRVCGLTPGQYRSAIEAEMERGEEPSYRGKATPPGGTAISGTARQQE